MNYHYCFRMFIRKQRVKVGCTFSDFILILFGVSEESIFGCFPHFIIYNLIICTYLYLYTYKHMPILHMHISYFTYRFYKYTHTSYFFQFCFICLSFVSMVQCNTFLFILSFLVHTFLSILSLFVCTVYPYYLFI